MRLFILLTLCSLVMASFSARADLYDSRAAEASSRVARADMEKAAAWLLAENTRALRKVRSFLARHGGAQSASCSIEAMDCVPDGDSYSCYPKFKETQESLESLDPRTPWGWVQECRLELNDGLACVTDRGNKKASCYDANSRARNFAL